jgi:amino acid adenylation domain-containing protein
VDEIVTFIETRCVLTQNIISYLRIEQEFIRGGDARTPFILSDSWNEITGEQFFNSAVFFAAQLQEQGIWNQPIVVKAEHRLETLILYLGVLMSGNYYVPLAEDLSESKSEEILRLLHAESVYTCENVEYRNESPQKGTLLKLQKSREKLPDNATLYVIFTSGSTGRPKGIIKSHKSMIAFLESYSRAFLFKEGDVLANQTPFCFDASAKDFYLMLQYRMDFHIIDRTMFFKPMEIVHLLNERKVTMIQWVPSALSILSQLRAFDKEKPLTLQKVFFVGESFPAKHLKYWQEQLPDTEFINLYGASEMSGVCCHFIVPASWSDDIIPLGKALPGQKVYLLEDDKLVKEAEIVGELCVESDTLADGYLDASDSGDKFTSFLTPEIHGGRYYRTGDLMQYDKKGNLKFVSRKDYQVKHMGHRIELGAIENAAEQVEGVDNSGVIYRKGMICLYYQGSMEKQKLQAALKKLLQSYMLPKKIFKLDVLPLNRNGKVDHLALQKM